MSDIIASGAVHSELALAAYATLSSGMSKAVIRENLVDTGMTEVQAQAFADTYTVVEQFNGIYGGSMTVFEDNVSHQKILSIRGTEPTDIRDLVNDLFYTFTGYNAQLDELTNKVGEWLDQGVLPQSFEVDGHSAGGFTAIALMPLFPNNITHAYVYNSPGPDGVWGNFADMLGLSVPDSKVTSFGTAGGISLIAGLGSTAGEQQIFVNSDSNSSHNIINLNNAMQSALLNFQNFLNTLPASDKDAIIQQLPDFRDFYLQGSTFVMNTAADDLRAFMLGGDTSDRLTGGKSDDYIYGNSGDDQLYGGDGVDSLYGGADNDRLEGGKGNDFLFGGKGFDTYVYNVGDGNDTIIDEDNQGQIIIKRNGATLLTTTLYKDLSGNIWRDATGSVTITHNSPWRVVLEDGGVIELGENFQNGDFGIHLAELPTITTTRTIVGDLNPLTGNADQYDAMGFVVEQDVLLDSLGNVVTNPSVSLSIFADNYLSIPARRLVA